ncbi:MAG TPA: substrate-binding domain-containing protein [Dermatophilaceae bacterium]|nr:substrate-binding domain-containing protein [Dermatophilaceae bacterium]
MARAHRVRDIAVQAGLSEATVDRVLHDRVNVSPRARRQVEQAVSELERQRSQLLLTGRTFLLDLVMQAPDRFTAAVRSALEAELPGLRPAIVRSRFHFREQAPPGELIAAMHRAVARGSDGIVLKAPDLPEIAAAVDSVVGRGVPVVTLVTDVSRCRRAAYVGIDNVAAGQTAAYLVSQWLRHTVGDVLVAVSRGSFRGEDERERGFREALASTDPERALVAVTDTDGLDASMRGAVAPALEANRRVCAVYSIGGGNGGIVEAFAAVGRTCEVFVAHDLDSDNIRLLREGKLSAVLHHDLGLDLRRVCQAVMQAHGALPGAPQSLPSSIQVVTPANLPSRMPFGVGPVS